MNTFSSTPGFAGSSVGMSDLLFASGWSWERISSEIDTFFGNPARMFQVGAIAMCLAVYILLRSRG